MSEHEARREDIAAYAIGALGPPESADLERHLATCEECSEYLRWLDPAVAVLPASVEQVEAPDRLRRSIMAEVEADLRSERRRRRKEGAAGFLSRIGWRPATAGLATAAVIAGLAAGYLVGGDADSPVETSTFVAERTEGGVGAVMKATLERAGEEGTLHVEQLPALPENRVYQAWIQRDGVMHASTPFVVKEDGAVEVAIEGSLEGASGVYITREPNPGSKHPTSAPIMGVSFS